MKIKTIFLLISVFGFCQMNWSQEYDCDAPNIKDIYKNALPLPHSLLSDSGYGFALLVGINDYNSSPMILPKLGAPAGEVKTLEKILKKNHYVVKTLTDQEATRENIQRWLNCLGRKARANDRLLFYFAGHGGNLLDLARKMDIPTREKYWDRISKSSTIGEDGQEKDELLLCVYQEKQTVLSEFLFMDEVTRWMSVSSAHQQLVWIDACYSGNMNKIFRLPLNFYTYRLLNDGFFAVTGIKDPVQDGKYGKVMLEGMLGEADKLFAGNGDGRISLYEMTIYIDHKLRGKILKTSGLVYKSRYILVGSGEFFLVESP